MILYRCKQDDNECSQCVKFHKDYPIPKNFMEVMGVPSRQINGASSFVPEPSTIEGKNKTYLEQVQDLVTNPSKKMTPDSDLNGVERCKVKL